MGTSKASPLRGVVGCPQEVANAHGVAGSNGTFCGELGVLHVTEGVWEAASVEVRESNCRLSALLL